MSWLKLILLVLQGVKAFADYARDKKLIDAGGQEEIARALRSHLEDIRLNEDIREDVRRRNAAAPAGSLPDDGWRRD
jgi:hypothetical protein